MVNLYGKCSQIYHTWILWGWYFAMCFFGGFTTSIFLKCHVNHLHLPTGSSTQGGHLKTLSTESFEWNWSVQGPNKANPWDFVGFFCQPQKKVGARITLPTVRPWKMGGNSKFGISGVFQGAPIFRCFCC